MQTIRTKDGIVLRNIPDDVSDEQIKARIERIRAEGAVAPKADAPAAEDTAESPYSAKNLAGAAVEPILSLLSGSAAIPVAGLAGLGTMAGNALGMSESDSADTVRKVADALTYQPQTQGGQTALHGLTYPLRKFAEGAENVGGMVTDVTGSPAAGTLANTAIQSLPMALGARYAPSGKPALPALDRVLTYPWRHAQGALNLIPAHRKRGGRVLNDVAGNDYTAIVNALENSRSNIPGVNLTSGQAASGVSNAKYSALMDLLEKREPTKYGRIASDQDAAMMNHLGRIARTPDELAMAETTRKVQTDPLYTAARQGPDVDVSGIVANIDDLVAKNPGNPTLLTELKKVRNGLLDEEGNVRVNAQEVLSTVDGLKTAIANKDNAFIKGELTNIKNAIINQVPDYKAANDLFRELSKPVNQMNIGAELVRAIEPIIGDKKRVARFASVVDNARQTIKKATGEPRFDRLEDVLTPDQMQIVKDVSAEITRNISMRNQATRGRSAMKEKVANALTQVEYPPMLSTKAMVIRRIMNYMRGNADKKTLSYLAGFADNPVEIARIMREAAPAEQRLITEFIKRRDQIVVGGAIGSVESQQQRYK